MRLPKIYLETTLFNFYVDKSRGEAHAYTVKLFQEIFAGNYEAFTSDYVVDELKKASFEKSAKMIALLTEYSVPVLSMNDEADRLADLYVTEEIIPLKYRTDGLHIAIATVNDLDMIVSMNFQHIVKRKTIRMCGAVNTMHGYHAIEIYSPMEVVESDND
jgi:hypothetical protein